MNTLYDILRARVWEVNPRKGTAQPRYLSHRFPIKDGMTYREVLLDCSKLMVNSFFEHFKGKSNATTE